MPLLRENRLQRLTHDEQIEYQSLLNLLGKPEGEAPDERLGFLS